MYVCVGGQVGPGGAAAEGDGRAGEIPEDGAEQRGHQRGAGLQHQRQVRAEPGGRQLHAQPRAPDAHRQRPAAGGHAPADECVLSCL